MALHFLMCSERSGSNLITKILNGHSNICGPAPKHILNPVARNLFRYEPIEEKENWDALLEDIYNLVNVSFSVWKNSFSEKELNDLAPVGDIKSLLQNIFYKEAKQFSKQNVFVKENHVYEFLPFLLFNFPESQYVYQVRDPRDMALSWKKSKVHPGGVVKGARQWQKDQQSTLKSFSELEKKEKGILIKYEELLSEPEYCVREVIEFLGFSYEPGMLEYHNDELTRKNSKRLKTWDNLSKPIISDNKNKYKSQLSEKEIKLIERICFFEMAHLDYQTEFEWEELEKISGEEIEQYHLKERAEVELDRDEGVKQNMKAKKTFYQKLI